MINVMVELQSTGYTPPILKYKKSSYPQSPNPVLPHQYFVMMACAPRGQGKTYSVCQLIKSFEKDPPVGEDGVKQTVRCIVVSPTFDANECFKSLKSLADEDVYRSYSPEILQEIVDDIKLKRKEYEDYQKQLVLWRKFQKIKDVSKLSIAELIELEQVMDFSEPDPVPYYTNFLVLDDLVGSRLYSNGKNAFSEVLLKNRHLQCNIIMMSQGVRSVPKIVRANVSVFWLGKFGSKALLDDLYTEIGSGSTTPEMFEQIYDLATQNQFGALVVDFTQPKDKKFSISFKDYIK